MRDTSLVWFFVEKNLGFFLFLARHSFSNAEIVCQLEGLLLAKVESVQDLVDMDAVGLFGEAWMDAQQPNAENEPVCNGAGNATCASNFCEAHGRRTNRPHLV